MSSTGRDGIIDITDDAASRRQQIQMYDTATRRQLVSMYLNVQWFAGVLHGTWLTINSIRCYIVTHLSMASLNYFAKYQNFHTTSLFQKQLIKCLETKHVHLHVIYFKLVEITFCISIPIKNSILVIRVINARLSQYKSTICYILSITLFVNFKTRRKLALWKQYTTPEWSFYSISLTF